MDQLWNSSTLWSKAYTVIAGRKVSDTLKVSDTWFYTWSFSYLHIMYFQPDTIYHIYNRGNQQQTIFFNRNNYIYFLEKVRKYIVPCSNILCWCLMPNHFHFLIDANKKSCEEITRPGMPTQRLTENIRLLLSSYTKGLQQQQNFKGNLFQQKTKAKAVTVGERSYAFTAFNYIH